MSVNDFIQDNDYPEWMTQAQRGIDWGALLMIGFCLFFAWSFIDITELTASNHTNAYVYRVSDYADAFDQGIFYSRWSPHTLNGYGAPVPHFYPSGATYIGGFISYLFTNDPIIAVRILYVMSIVIAGSMTYNFVAQRTSSRAGLVAGLLYISCPIIMQTIPQIEGDLPLALGTALLPSLLWAVNRLLQRNQALDFFLIAMIVALTIFTVPIILLQSVIAVLVLLIVEFRDQPNWNKLRSTCSAFAIGGLISSVYWLPALAQFSQIEWHASLMSVAPFELSFSMLLSQAQPIDGGIVIQLTRYPLGWGLLLALLVNTILLVLSKHDKRLSGSFFLLGLCILAFNLLLVPERPFWLVLVVLSFAIACSYVAQPLQLTPSLSALVAGILIWIFVSTTHLWIVPQPALFIDDISPQSQVEYEQSRYGFAGLPNGLSLPSNLAPNIASEQAIITEYSENISRIISSRLPVPRIDESAYSGRYTYSAPIETPIIYGRGYFDAWQAIADDTQLTVRESADSLILVELPTGTDRTVTFRLGLTPISRLAWGISLIALVICIIYWGYRWQKTELDYDESNLLSKNTTRLLVILLVIACIVRILGATQFRSNFVAQPQYTMNSALFVRSNYDRTFQLLAYDVKRPDANNLRNFEIGTFWTVVNPTSTQYLVQLRITNNIQRQIVYESGFTHAGYFPTNRLENRQIVPQIYQVSLPDDISSGNYIMIFDIVECNTFCNPDTFSRDSADGQISISRPIIVE